MQNVTLRVVHFTAFLAIVWSVAGLILGLHPANEGRRYFVTTSLIGWGKPRISPVLAVMVGNQQEVS